MTESSSRDRLRGRLWIASLVVIVVSAVAIGAALVRRSATKSAPVATISLRVATQLPDPLAVPAQTAPDTSGVTVPLVKPAAGKISLLYFGYTHCPDVCPLDMATLSAAMRTLPASQRARIRVVFVTVDPERDKPSDLRSWLDNYDPAFIGVTPPLAETNATLEKMGYAAVTREDIPGSDGYAVAHPAGVYAYTDDGLAHVAFFGSNPPKDVAHDLELLLKGWTQAR